MTNENPKHYFPKLLKRKIHEIVRLVQRMVPHIKKVGYSSFGVPKLESNKRTISNLYV